MGDSEIILDAKNVYKSFSATKALNDFSMVIREGEVHGLIGENGSGKSTFSTIISGAQKCDSGSFILSGSDYAPKDMVLAQKAGICMIAQEAATFPGVTVAYNIFAGNLTGFTRMGFINEKKLNAEAKKALQRIGVSDIEPEQLIDGLNFEDRKIVEIARAMYFEPRILIVDETTTALAQKGRTILYHLIEEQKNTKRAVLFISHDLDELKEVCNIVTVMRDGVFIKTLQAEEITPENMRTYMVGRELTDNYFRSDYECTYEPEVVIESRHATLDGEIRNISIQIHKGEILGLGGLSNSGMHEVGRMFAGINRPITGEVIIPEKNVVITNPIQAIKNGVGYVSKDRDKEALIQNDTIMSNIEMVSYDRLTKKGIIRKKDEKALAQEQIDSLRIKCQSPTQYVQELSGGNKQKVVFGKWIAKDCDVLILDCPTRGVDIGVKVDMYRLITELKQQGKAILLISEELPELLGMSDRMLIFKDGKISTELSRSKEIAEHDVIQYMI
ncbi:ribose import ATP-binding protein RbsA [Lachnospiraceae bacterium]|nr:ribose import ATP-binding protein RbsA [Lachnospiraceae bacterium]